MPSGWAPCYPYLLGELTEAEMPQPSASIAELAGETVEAEMTQSAIVTAPGHNYPEL